VKITENQLRDLIREELLQEGFLSDLWHNARKGLSKFVRPDELNGDMSIEEAEGEIDRAVLQYALSTVQQAGGTAADISQGVEAARKYVANQGYQVDDQGVEQR